MDDIKAAMKIAASGLNAQSARLRVVAENIANADSTAPAPGLEPYRRQAPIFSHFVDRATGADLVRLARVAPDPTPFSLRYEPGHPAANPEGFVQYPNVDPLVEMMDLREAQRSYEAGLGAMETLRAMSGATLRILE